MEKCMESEAVVFEHASQGSFSEDSPKKQNKNSEDLDFDDVFGGPPRRFSMQEVRVGYSFGELMTSEEDRISSPSSQRREKSVFPEESVVRRRYPSDDFFDDIFRGDESYSSPRRSDRDGDGSFEQSPSSRFSGVAHKPEIFGTSLPAQLSLPAKSTKALDFSAFASQNHGQFKMDGTANPVNSSRSSSSSSRFYHRNPLASFSSEDSSSTVTSDPKDGVENLKRDNKSVESPIDGNQFHFSIYKWAGKGVPMLTPLVDRNNFKITSRKDGMASSNGKTEGGFTESKTSVVTSQNLSANIAPESLKIDCEKENCCKEEMRELQFSIEEALYDSLEPESQSISKNSVALSGARHDIETEEMKARDEINTRNEVGNEIPVKSEMKSLHAYLAEELEQPEMRENETIISKRDEFNVHESKKVKKNEETRTNSNREDANKSNFIGAAKNSSVNSAKSGVKGKIKKFVQIFNHDADSRPKPDTHTQNQSNKWKGVGVDKKEDEVKSNAAKVKENVELDSVDKKPDISLKVDEHLNKDEARVKSQTKTSSFRKSFRRDSISVENSDDLFEEYFLVQELSDDHEKVTESDEGYDEMKALDAKIQQWSIGKKGNIRSLLSTLQFVLWPGNGWKPVPLVDLIESSAVKRAYQKALLRLHPDKLQQTGAASNQKYIAEKVFDILQEAWDQFNTLAPL